MTERLFAAGGAGVVAAARRAPPVRRHGESQEGAGAQAQPDWIPQRYTWPLCHFCGAALVLGCGRGLTFGICRRVSQLALAGTAAPAAAARAGRHTAQRLPRASRPRDVRTRAARARAHLRLQGAGAGQDAAVSAQHRTVLHLQQGAVDPPY